MSHDIVDKFSTHLKNVLTRALCFVVELNDPTIEAHHLLWALGTQKGCIGGEILKKVGVKQGDLRVLVGATASFRMNPTEAANATLHLSNDAKRIVEKAVLTANIYGHRFVGTEHLLSGILQVNTPLIDQFFEKQKTDLKELRQQLSIVLKSTSKFPELTGAISNGTNLEATAQAVMLEEENDKMPALEYFARELTSTTSQKTIDPVIGRDGEIERLMQILCRRTKNNPLLVGAPGVGKTAIVEGLAKRIVEGTVPEILQDKKIFALDLALLIAGTMYRGEFEGRLRQIVDEIKKHEDVILFIDEIHTIVGAGAASGSLDAANILKPALARGDIRCIGATTPEECKKQIESDSALERRFQSILVDEPSQADSVTILQGLAPYYENFHQVRILPDAIAQAVALSSRYVPDRQLPDKAIDLMDEAAAAAKMERGQNDAAQQHRSLEQELARVREAKRQAVVEERFQEASVLKEKEEQVRSSISHTKKETTAPLFSIDGVDIARVISRMTGIPIHELTHQTSASADDLARALQTGIIGQDEVVSQVASALARAKSGLSHPKRPLSSLLFIGPSGVGKTELAKAVARTFFYNPKNFIRLDMSEYAEGFTISKLIGSPAGYVGYKDQSNLSDRVKQRPYSVVLFDELEKAHPDVQNLLLQILEEGELTDATGKMVSFKNTIVILTTNIGLERFEHGGIGFAQSLETQKSERTQDIRKELEERFRPELINRMDHICVFDALSTEALQRIVEKELNELVERLNASHQLCVRWQPNVSQHLALSLDKKLGARSVRQKIQQEVETKIAERLSKKDRPSRLRVSVHNTIIKVTKE
ncbi:ATP-dependent Clp protease ATP-binding subunit [Candidatus Uhrbacteria bacterium]|nr:ATP-dependent Clp protease ATP-binding subunit [Candidatus Uhrbacteria bacterium]